MTREILPGKREESLERMPSARSAATLEVRHFPEVFPQQNNVLMFS